MVEEVINEEVIQEEKESVLKTLLKHLGCDRHVRIGIEFECGAGFKKVLNAATAVEVCTFLVLFPPDDCVLRLKAFGEDGIIEQETMKAIAVPIDHICAIEIDPVEVDVPK